MKSSYLLLSLALGFGLTACASSNASYPSVPYSTVAHQVGIEGPGTQERPETLAQWKVMAERLASQAAPSLYGVAVSSHALGVSSAFDVAFHDFFVSALHDQGVAVDDRGARVEIDTYPITFPAHPNHVRNSSGQTGYAPSTEFGVSVRVFEGSRLMFSGSETYYLTSGDIHNYRPLSKPVDKRNVRVVGE